MANNMNKHHTKKTQSPPEIQNMVLKVTTQEEAPQRRPNMEPRGMLTSSIQLKNPLVRELTTPKNCLLVRLVYILRGEERGGNIPGAMTLKILRKPNNPLLMEKLKRGKKQKLGYSA
jgi:hypothetical protein